MQLTVDFFATAAFGVIYLLLGVAGVKNFDWFSKTTIRMMVRRYGEKSARQRGFTPGRLRLIVWAAVGAGALLIAVALSTLFGWAHPLHD